MVLVLCLSLTAFFSVTEWNRAQAKARISFDIACIEARLLIFDGLSEAKLVLQGCVALFDSSESVSRKQWKGYMGSLELTADLQGIQGFGYS